MARTACDRLSARDNGFLLWERGNVRMHVATVMVFDSGPLRGPEGGVDIAAVKRATAAVLHLVPRYRQRLRAIPLFDHAVWVDDPHFDLDHHVRHTALPRPGDAEQLGKLAARVMAQPLDRERPLWETWVVEGLEGGDRFAMITKIHHCMIDGASGIDLGHVQMSLSPEAREPGEPPPFQPRPAPSGFELWRDELRRQAGIPLEAVRDFHRFSRDAGDLGEELRTRARALAESAGLATRADETPLNGRLGPHRRVDWLVCRLDDLKAIRRAWSCTIHDVVLTLVTGAVRGTLASRGADPASPTFRVSSPLAVRTEADRGQLGNRVSPWIVELPVGTDDPRAQLDAIREETRRLDEERSALGVQAMLQVAEWTPATLLSLGAQAVSGPVNGIVVHVPGPQEPLYFQGARLRAIHPLVPLTENVGLGIAVTSYAGRVHFGFVADPALVPDLDAFVGRTREALERVAREAGVDLASPDADEPKQLVRAADPAE